MDTTTCMVCGTVNPHGGLMYAHQNAIPVGVICAYRLGCEPGVQRPENG